tara:strand:- start:711 stop:1682 length:972 start_codon:yes stop_codon:yes gene_type:complete
VIYEPETEAGDEQVAETSAETTEAVSTDTGSVDESPAVETAAEPTEEPIEDAPDVVDWNGELESVQESDWFNNLSENVRTGILRGLETKYQNWQRGYTDKFQDLARQRKSIDRKLEEVRTQEQRVQKWLHGDIDPLVEKQREIDELKIAHKSAVDTLRTQYEDAQEKMKTSRGSEFDDAVKARDEALARAQQYETTLKEQEEFQTEQVVDQFEHWLRTEAPDVYENDEAFYSLCVLCTGGVTPEDAVQMVRGKYGAPQTEVAPAPTPEPAPEPDPVPEGMKLMNMGPDTASATETGETRSFDDIMDQMRRSAAREQEILINSG